MLTQKLGYAGAMNWLPFERCSVSETNNPKGLWSIDPIAERGDQAETCEEVAGGFVVSGCDGAKVLQAAEVRSMTLRRRKSSPSKGRQRLRLDLLGMTGVVPRSSRKERK